MEQVLGAASSGVFAVEVPDISSHRAGNTGIEGVWRFDSGAPGKRVMISALVHGNELCGAWALKELLDAGVRPSSGSIVLAFCNLAAFDRFDANDHDASRFADEDLNRQWSRDRMTSPTTYERRRAREIEAFLHEADWLLDLHSMHEHSEPLCLPGMLPENLDLALQMKSPRVVVVDAGHDDGVRMRDFDAFGSTSGAGSGKRALLIECGFHGDPTSIDVAKDQCARFLELAGVVDLKEREKTSVWKLPDPTHRLVVEVTGKAVAKNADARFDAPFSGLEVIENAGTVIGHDGVDQIRTPHDDAVLVMPSIRQARAGVTVVRFARRRS